MAISATKIATFKRAGVAAATWYVKSQCRMTRPYWDANHGRFIYNRYLPDGRTVLGLGWTQGRGIFVTLAAWELTGGDTFLQTARLAAEYVKILQVHDCPDNPRRQFAIREEIPQSGYSAPRDATESILGMLFLHRATGENDYLDRAVNYARWFDANAWGRDGWPCNWVDLCTRARPKPGTGIQAAQAILFHHLHQATGVRKYRTYVRRIADLTLARHVRADGAVVTNSSMSHHAGPGGVMLNDDGLMIGLLCAHQCTGRAKYLDAVIRHAHWLMANITRPPAMISALPCMCTIMVELSAVTGEEVYREWAADMLTKHVLPLQVRSRRDPLTDGAFRGEDEPVEHYGPKRAKKTDFITTRVTCYSALACLKLAGIVGPYYGALGWDRRIRRTRRLPTIRPS